MEYSGNLAKFFDGAQGMDYSLCALKVAPDPDSPMSLFGSTIQTGGMINLLHSAEDKALDTWEKQVRRGYVKKVQDLQLNGPVIEMVGNQNPNTVFITTPIGLYQTLGIRLPILVIVVKNLRKQFSFDVLVMDDKNIRRRFRFSNGQATSRIKPFLTYIPLRMDDGWNLLQLNLQEITYRTFGSNYKETLRLQINASCRLRRVSFNMSLTSALVSPTEA